MITFHNSSINTQWQGSSPTFYTTEGSIDPQERQISGIGTYAETKKYHLPSYELIAATYTPSSQDVRSVPASMLCKEPQFLYNLASTTNAQAVVPHLNYYDGQQAAREFSFDCMSGHTASIVPTETTRDSNETSDASIQIPMRSSQCAECGKRFAGEYSRRNLSRHMNQKHEEAERMYPCKECDRTFMRSDARLKHYRKHHPNLDVGPPIQRG